MARKAARLKMGYYPLPELEARNIHRLLPILSCRLTVIHQVVVIRHYWLIEQTP